MTLDTYQQFVDAEYSGKNDLTVDTVNMYQTILKYQQQNRDLVGKILPSMYLKFVAAQQTHAYRIESTLLDDLFPHMKMDGMKLYDETLHEQLLSQEHTRFKFEKDCEATRKSCADLLNKYVDTNVHKRAYVFGEWLLTTLDSKINAPREVVYIIIEHEFGMAKPSAHGKCFNGGEFDVIVYVSDSGESALETFMSFEPVAPFAVCYRAGQDSFFFSNWYESRAKLAKPEIIRQSFEFTSYEQHIKRLVRKGFVEGTQPFTFLFLVRREDLASLPDESETENAKCGLCDILGICNARDQSPPTDLCLNAKARAGVLYLDVIFSCQQNSREKANGFQLNLSGPPVLKFAHQKDRQELLDAFIAEQCVAFKCSYNPAVDSSPFEYIGLARGNDKSNLQQIVRDFATTGIHLTKFPLD